MLGCEDDYNAMFLPVANIISKHGINNERFIKDLADYFCAFGGPNDTELDREQFLKKSRIKWR